jgi:SAM-dependent methyltransferase
MSSFGENPRGGDWAAERGDKWGRHLFEMEATLKPLDAPLIDALQLSEPGSFADVACGGGGTTLELSRSAPPGSIVHGYDISPRLLELARERASAAGRDIRFDTADVARATPRAPYARLLSRFGVMFFDDPPAAFANLTHWLAPGGRFAFAVWGPRAENAWQATVRDVVAELVELPPVPADAPGPFRYADAAPLLALLERAGFARLTQQQVRRALPVGGGMPAEPAARFALAAFSSFGELLADAGEAAQREAQHRVAARLADHERDGAVWLDSSVTIVSGIRP